MWRPNRVLVDLTTHGINIMLNYCATDSIIACDHIVGAHLIDLFLDNLRNLVSSAKDNISAGRDGPYMFKNDASPPFEFKIFVVNNGIGSGKSIIKFSTTAET